MRRLITPPSKPNPWGVREDWAVRTVPDDYNLSGADLSMGCRLVDPAGGKPAHGWIQTASGLPFWPLHPDWYMVEFDDISHHLAQRPRYGGACKRFYSVAEHSVHMANWGLGQGFSLPILVWLLLHDAPEYVLPDIQTPIGKDNFPGFRGYERNVMGAVVLAFNRRFGSALILPAEEPREVKEADRRVVFNEKEQLMPNAPYKWVDEGVTRPLEVIGGMGWDWEDACRMHREFLAACVEAARNKQKQFAVRISTSV